MIDALLNRKSQAKLTTPAPSNEQIKQLLEAALRAPDHANLKPWRFIVVEGEAGLNAFGQVMVEAKSALALEAGEGFSDEQAEKLAAKAHRAPMIVLPVLQSTQHPKVPEIEQILSLGAACQNILLGLDALGFGGIWRTGDIAFTDSMHQAFSLQTHEKLLGFIYVGSVSADAPVKKIPAHNVDDFLSFWP